MANRLIKSRKFRSPKEPKKDSKSRKSDSKGKSSRTAGNGGAFVAAARSLNPGDIHSQKGSETAHPAGWLNQRLLNLVVFQVS